MTQPRINHPAMIVPDAIPALQALGDAVSKGGLEERTILLVLMRASQINGCGVCLDGHAAHALELDREARAAGHYRRLAGYAVLLGCRASGAGADRSCHPPGRPPGPRA